ncbi:MAG: hypothetical protein LUE14_11735 [Clostridiales bacterium]|nr:hypothetical protein [Clostridiales bacterium]MCD8110747.1 hypothetical protein [Clostridiales bacterium]
MSDSVTEKEMLSNLIDSYANLQRIIKSDDAKQEAEYQLQLIKAKLESFGIITSDLERKSN